MCFCQRPSSRQEAIRSGSTIAMGMDPTLGSALIAIATANGWAEPVAEAIELGAELADHSKAGGNVHMQPLTPVAQSLDAAVIVDCGLLLARQARQLLCRHCMHCILLLAMCFVSFHYMDTLLSAHSQLCKRQSEHTPLVPGHPDQGGGAAWRCDCCVLLE